VREEDRLVLVLIADEEKGLQFLLTNDALDAIAFIQGLMAVDVEDFVGSAKGFDGFEMEQQVIQLLELTLHRFFIHMFIFHENKQIPVTSFHSIRF
jgi:hypothetical protein